MQNTEYEKKHRLSRDMQMIWNLKIKKGGGRLRNEPAEVIRLWRIFYVVVGSWDYSLNATAISEGFQTVT